MKGILARWLATVIAALITVWLVQAVGLKLEWPATWRIIIFVPILGLVNATIGKLLRLFSAPINCLTMGLFSFIVNGIVFYVAGVATGAQMEFWAAVMGAVCLGVVSAPLNNLFSKLDK